MRHAARDSRLLPLAFAALGIVYGDIGTSPLYALRECFIAPGAPAVTRANVLGVLSLIFWSLIAVVTLKYLTWVMRADNHGEGGILALTALTAPAGARRGAGWVVALGIFGAALLYGDGMITPAISVLSAMEGLGIATPALEPYVVPATIVVLVALFSVQRRGTARIGRLFGPVTLLWFGCLALLGVRSLVAEWSVLGALSPTHAVDFFAANGTRGLLVLGGVFLVVTGAEALYADMGHFGHAPIRLGWFALVLPALLLNYFGQGALLLRDPTAIRNPLYLLAPTWAVAPLIVVATAATVIASQAVISGAFSLTNQALQLGYMPRLRVEHSSESEIGQVYVPLVNWTLLLATVLLVVAFGSSGALAGAYGVAVSTTMVITTVLAYLCARRVWGWPLLPTAALAAAFLSIDLAFFGINLTKIREGGYVPLAVGAFVYLVMRTWQRGRALLQSRVRGKPYAVEELLAELRKGEIRRLQGTAVYLDARGDGVPPTVLRSVRFTGSLHERIILLTVRSEEVPRLRGSERLEVIEHAPGLIRVIARYGFMERPHLPGIIRQLQRHGLEIDTEETIYVLGRETLVIRDGRGMPRWRKRLFRFLSRNALRPTLHFRIPPDRVVEIGEQIRL